MTFGLPNFIKPLIQPLSDPAQWTVANIVAAIAALAAIVAALAALPGAISTIWSIWQQLRNARLLKREPTLAVYGKETIEAATRNYIKPHCSSVDPTQKDEMCDIDVERKSLFEVVDKFLVPNSPHRHLLLLADSGMGKSSFVLNYYARNQRHSKHKRHRLVVVPLNDPKADEYIKPIQNPQDVVLFLDAFDEDAKAIDDYRKRLAELMDACRPFKRVLITCRTQFFQTDEVLPRRTGIGRVGAVRLGEKKVYEFSRLYLAPFNDFQIRRFLRKRYSILQWRQRKKARDLIEKVPFLSVRPMLLAYMPDLTNRDKQIEYRFQLYEVLVEKWLEYEEGLVNKDALRTFSEHLAIDLYLNHQKRGAERIPYDELIPLAKEWDISLKDWQIRGRSLLNRDGEGNYKFAHRSIMEYLVTKRIMSGDYANLNINLTEQMELFLREILLEDMRIADKLPKTNQIEIILHELNPTRAMMIEYVKRLVNVRLNATLFKDLLIELELTDDSEQPPQPGRYLLDVYDESSGSLLILGAPGAGKTTLLLQLMYDLLHRAEQNVWHPIPIVFDLTSWSERQLPLADWLVDRLFKEYTVSKDLGRTWVRTNQILPFLDSLDGVRPEYHAACVEAINSFRRNHSWLPLVVCSRESVYGALGKNLGFQRVITIQPPSREKVELFLTQGGEALAALRQVLRANPRLWELLDQPLMIGIVASAFAGQPVTVLHTHGVLEDHWRNIFQHYVTLMLRSQGPTTHYTAKQTLRWLTWLAQQLIQHSQTVFDIGCLQPDWLPTPAQQLLARVGARVTGGLFGILIWILFWSLYTTLGSLMIGWLFWLSIRPSDEPVEKASITGSATPMVRFIREKRRNIWKRKGLEKIGPYSKLLRVADAMLETVEKLRWSWSGMRLGMVSGLFCGLITGLNYGGLVIGLFGGLLIGLGGVLLDGLCSEEVTMGIMPNEGMRRSLRSAIIAGLVSGVLGGLFGWLLFGMIFGIFSGLVFWLFGGLRGGGYYCLQHLLIRILLVYNNYAPWRYADFLDYAAESLFLRKVGGGYMFSYRNLLEYFGSLNIEAELILQPPWVTKIIGNKDKGK